jgi:hypothetical protein
VKEVRAFLWLTSFYRRLVPNFLDTAKPLTEVTRKDVPFAWGEWQQNAFDRVNEALCSISVLAYPDFLKEFILTTDASKTTVGAILSQIQHGVERPINFGIRQLNQAERNYSASELNLLAIVWAK